MQISQVLDLLTHATANFCKFVMKYMILLNVPTLKVGGVFLDISKAFDRA